MRRIFVSHSTDQEDAGALQYLDRLVALLEGQKDEAGRRIYDVFLDRKSLEGSDDWSQKIVNQLVYCHAAVIVLTPRALDSNYVRFEVSNLVARRARDLDENNQPLFPVVPLIPWVEGQRPTRSDFQTDVAKRLESDFWKSIQFTAHNDYVGPFTPEEAVSKLVSVFKNHLMSSVNPLAALERDISLRLDSVRPDALEAGALRAGFPPPAPGLDAMTASLYMARQLLMCTMQQIWEALDEMREALKDNIGPLFELLAPSWVSAEAARELLKRLQSTSPKGCTVVNGSLATFTPEMYVRRARGKRPISAGMIMQVPDSVLAANDFGDLKRRITLSLGQTLGLRGKVPDSDYARQLAREIDSRLQVVPLVVAVPVSEVSMPMLVELSRLEEFKQVLFLALSGNEPVPFRPPEGAVVLMPQMQGKQEESIHTLYSNIESRIFPPRR